MHCVEIMFGAQDTMTPDLAAKLSQKASEFAATVYLERGKTRLCVNSLISILALDLRRGTPVTVCAEGDDAEKAVSAVVGLLKG